ncbi:MAG: FAD-dependent oxidoreductase [Actinomycetes bacterium]
MVTGLDAEIAVVGLGALGSSALWRLAVRGRDVIGIEQYRPGHPHGSTHGLTRLFRTLCFEHPGLVPVACRSLGLWRELEEESGNELLRLSGGLMIGARDSRVVAGVLEAARAGAQDVDVLSARRLRGTFPQHGDVRDDDVAVWDPEAGVGRPEAAVVSAVAAARARGARVVEQVGVQAVEPVDDGVRVRTSARDFVVRQAVVTPGPWLSRLVPALPMRPLRTPLTWFSPSGDPAEYELGRFPVFIRQLHDGAALWGHGSTGDHGVKIGPDDDGNYHHVDPDRVDRSIGPGDYALISRLVGRVLPGLDRNAA